MFQWFLLGLASASAQASATAAGPGPAGASLSVPAAAPARGAHRCSIQGGEVVPTAQVARDLAEAIIRGRQDAAESAMFELHVVRVGDDGWDVVQTMRDRIEPDGTLTHIDGGGMAIRIDRCNGAVLFINYLI